MIRLGDYNTLTVLRQTDFGVYLEGDATGDVLLPRRYVPEGTKPGDVLSVFIYLDNEERLVATTERPLARVGDFAFLEVAWVNRYGAFLRWGPIKDLFCPFGEQKKKLDVGDCCLVHVHIDEQSYRLVASTKVERYLKGDFPPYAKGDAVSLIVWQRTELGYKVIVDNAYAGLVYRDQVFRHIRLGDRLTGYIAAVRDDGKLDVVLQPAGRQHQADFAATLLQYLKEHDGVCHLGDKSDADDIAQQFGVSKKTFKRAVGDLYKRRLVTPGPLSTRLNR